ncbi:zinc dependent phospholipase C family protein [Desulfosporosinus sp. PR]|uniref:zinc dependent phospholipase C family protein n=1 Tax=Candidatus Desulfosporosinus nitrosoreducens TaxID=3401928 RepID=UPI0027ED135F|nr:zinc dependent phospholipase C family protein [Desulfosporosinus sp. PR]MDQ7096826.1 zinc dependent phospholipase C family protein [Desulfosporosinus sp. PR]
MPKELTHWHIAGAAVQKGIPAQLGKMIVSNPALFYLGAIAHDIAFYDLSQPPEARIERISNQLHGVDGENTLLPLIAMMEKALCRNEAEALLAFLLGMLTHFVADSTFHPMVYYMSGNYFANSAAEREKAVFRHRLLETAIDLWLETVDPLEYPSDLIHLWREAGEAGRQALRLLVEHYTYNGDKSVPAHFKIAWRNHRFLQTAFRWSTPRLILTLYRRFGNPAAEKEEALFYPQRFDLAFFDSALHWLHPVTGEAYEMSLGQLFDGAVEKVASLFHDLGLVSRDAWPDLLRSYSPLSLDSGLPYVSVKQMTFFRPDPIEEPLRKGL